ncbi:MAG: proteasome subunit beta, partial [Actinobacteria bacterium]|nr:proteasome subunit beta [Actinomycetota bacterium]
MTLPLFSPTDDPGPSFTALLRRLDPVAPPPQGPIEASPGFTVTHGTTIVALRFDEGVIMAGDRRA